MEKLYQNLILPIIGGFIAVLIVFVVIQTAAKREISKEIHRKEVEYMDEAIESYFANQKSFLSKVLLNVPEGKQLLSKFENDPLLYSTVDLVGTFDLDEKTVVYRHKYRFNFDSTNLYKVLVNYYGGMLKEKQNKYFFFYFIGDTSEHSISSTYLIGVRSYSGKGILVGEMLFPTLYMRMPSALRNRIYMTMKLNDYKGPYTILSPTYPPEIKLYILFKNPISIQDVLSSLKEYLGWVVTVFVLAMFITLLVTIEAFKYNMERKLHPLASLLEYLSLFKIEEFEKMARSLDELSDKEIDKVVSLLGKIKDLVVIDPLTGAFSREYTLRRIEEELNECHREQKTLSVLYMDFDDFKKINDNYGHLVGDKVLKAFVDLVKRTTRPYDIIGRVGGEEFILVLPNVPMSEAMQVAHRLLRAVNKELEIRVGKKVIKPTISIGVTSFRPTDKRPEQILERADSALLKAKEAGKNRVIGIY